MLDAVRRLIPALWLGLLLGVALLATPAPFATLDRAQAGRVVQWIFAREAPASVTLGVVVLLLERRHGLDAWRAGAARSQFTGGMLCAIAAVGCTIVGYDVLQPYMEAARLARAAGAPAPAGLSFGQLHALSFGLFGVKIVAVAVLAWLAVRPARVPSRDATPPAVSPPASS